jgi:hypothetical protein
MRSLYGTVPNSLPTSIITAVKKPLIACSQIFQPIRKAITTTASTATQNSKPVRIFGNEGGPCLGALGGGAASD